jgi:1-acyl-sn-glycerol-3-phosphate acyltransferase
VQPSPPSIPQRARVAWSIVAGWSLTVVFCAVVIASALITLGRCWRWLTPPQARWWGRTMLRLQGVEVEYEGLEHLEGEAMRVVTFNHSSGLDPMLITSMYPRSATSAIKREILYVPIVGLAIKLMGFLLIDRGKGGRGRDTLRLAAARMRRDSMTVFIAPEGTRSRDGSLQPFKRGALHLAMVSGAPLVPVVVHGAFDLWPRHRWGARPGLVRVRVLPPIDTHALTPETLDAFSDELRARYERTLAAMDADRRHVVGPTA